MAFFRACGLAVIFTAACAKDAVGVALQAKCHTLLSGLSASPYSNEELAIFCRARVPLPICSDALNSLGQKPWALQSIDATCKRWERDFKMRTLEMTPARRAMSFGDLQATMDDIMKKKGAVGLCKDQSVDQCASYKASEYPKYTQQMTDTLQKKSSQLGQVMGGGQSAAQDATSAVKDATGKAELHKEPIMAPASMSGVAAFGVGLIATSLVVLVGASVSRARPARGMFTRSLAAEDVQESGMAMRATEE